MAINPIDQSPSLVNMKEVKKKLNSPEQTSSGEENSLLKKNLNYLREQDYIKFVISDKNDLEYSIRFLQDNSLNVEALFQPAWGTSLQWIAEEVLGRGINARVLPQLHKIIWGERRGV